MVLALVVNFFCLIFGGIAPTARRRYWTIFLRPERAPARCSAEAKGCVGHGLRSKKPRSYSRRVKLRRVHLPGQPIRFTSVQSRGRSFSLSLGEKQGFVVVPLGIH